MDNKKIILYDGECKLCIRSVKFIHHRDKNDLFITIPIQSDKGIEHANNFGIQHINPHSVVLIEDENYREKSSAGIRILELLKGTRWMANFIGLLPEKFNNKIYDFIARHRVHFSGKKVGGKVE